MQLRDEGGEDVLKFASMRRAQLSQSPSLPVSGCSNLQVPESRASGAIRSDRAAAEVERPVSAAGPHGIPASAVGPEADTQPIE
jgi:hypothetical protein